MRRLLALGVLLGLGLGCRPAPVAAPEPAAPAAPEKPAVIVEIPLAKPEAALVPALAEHLGLLLDDAGEWATWRAALENQRTWLARQKPGRTFRFGPRTVALADQQRAVDTLLAWLREEPTPQALAQRLPTAFDLYESVGGRDGQMLITGYYEPIVEGCRKPQPGCQEPIYGSPGLSLVSVDLGAFDPQWQGQRIAGMLQGNKLVPYPDRREIREKGLLRGKEIAWARDRVDIFFIEVQGSGTLRLAEGGEMRIGYAGANGRPYRSIGKVLIDQGKLEKERVSMQSIRAYLAENPEEVDPILDHNLSTVFFRQLEGPAVGNLGFPVQAGRTVAADQSYFPGGTLGFLLTEKPSPTPDGASQVDSLVGRFVVVQDTGGAIRGPHRLDLFWGRGSEAATPAGLMRQPGRFFVLVPK